MVASLSPQNLTIGRLASAAGVNVETIRYYQRIGLINKPEKPHHGFRIYSTQALDKIKFTKRAQQLGFSLVEIVELLELGSENCCDVRNRAEKKRDKIVKQIEDLQALHSTLDELISACLSGKNNQKCPIVETLQAKSI